MNILEEIVMHKRREVDDRMKAVPVKRLEQSEYFSVPTVSMKEYIRRKDLTGIIAEFKRQSPSKGIINADASVARTTRGYADAGASALSVLTDQKFFGGNDTDLLEARRNNTCPILRKDFTIDEYQIIEAKAIGADAILLIAAVLEPAKSKQFASLAHSVGLQVLLEVHNEKELEENLMAGADLIGVNNRDLKTFSVSTEISKRLAPLIPVDIIRVSESGISDPDTIADLRSYGYEAFLVGENFMKYPAPEIAAAEFMKQLKYRIVR